MKFFLCNFSFTDLFKIFEHLPIWDICIVMIVSFGTDRSGQTIQTRIRLLDLEEQVYQRLQCLLLHLHPFPT